MQGVRDAAVELLHTLVAVHAEVSIVYLSFVLGGIKTGISTMTTLYLDLLSTLLSGQ